MIGDFRYKRAGHLENGACEQQYREHLAKRPLALLLKGGLVLQRSGGYDSYRPPDHDNKKPVYLYDFALSG